LLFASLLLADQVYDAQPFAANDATAFGAGNSVQMVDALERLAERLEKRVQALEDQA
jgi:hypothetical protein